MEGSETTAMPTAKYVLGIDLGTTNSVVAYADLDRDELQIELLPIPQVVAASTVEARSSLPSFLYLCPEQEAASGAYDLPWASQRGFVVGELARRQAAEVPDRTLSGAKSWLCHSRVDRHEPILPWGAADELTKLSPVTASQRYLEHLVDAWQHAFPDAPIADQQVVLTVPASFDASARELTRQAALAAGLPEDFVLLEEPQAAVYSWLAEQGDRWRRQLAVDDMLLVCDVGGGTTDLTLVRVGQDTGELVLERVAVGRHILVGGDNMDLALAHHAAGLLAQRGVELDPWQSVSLWHACRAAKEVLLAEDGPETHGVSVLGRGTKLIGGTVTVELERDAVRSLIVDGFLPRTSLDDRPVRQRASGFQEIGLPFESDAAISKHIAAFLHGHAEAGAEAIRPTHVLLNGGVFKASALGRRLLDVLADWFGQSPPGLLGGHHDLDHAVAGGAAAYGWVRQHGGMRIRGGTARSYYVGIETAAMAIPGAPRPLRPLCVVPLGLEEGSELDVPSSEIGLVVGQPAQFRFFSSSLRKQDQPGDLLPSCQHPDLVETDSLEATLPANDQDESEEYYEPVRFHTRVTELGMLELWCQSTRSDQRWKLEFSVREDADRMEGSPTSKAP